jgi:hypothetical protein
MRGRHGAAWLRYASRAQGRTSETALDEYGLLKTMIDQWRGVFDDAFDPGERHRVRSFISIAMDGRNAAYHASSPLQDDDALRYLDAIHQLLKLTKAPPAEIDAVKRAYDEERRAGEPPPPDTPAPDKVANGLNTRQRRTARADQVEQEVNELIKRFSYFLTVFDKEPPFKKFDQLRAHLVTTEMRKRLQSGAKTAIDAEFCFSMYTTLQAWGIGQRGSRLVPRDAFCQEMASRAGEIGRFDGLSIDSPTLPIQKIASELWSLIDALRIVDNKAKMVAGSKALHHLLPDLVFPIDRIYTRTFFRLHMPTFQGQFGGQQPVFMEIFTAFARIARNVPLSIYVGAEGYPWRTSRTKVIDNAVVGFCTNQLPLARPHLPRLSAAAPAPYTRALLANCLMINVYILPRGQPIHRFPS